MILMTPIEDGIDDGNGVHLTVINAVIRHLFSKHFFCFSLSSPGTFYGRKIRVDTETDGMVSSEMSRLGKFCVFSLIPRFSR